VFALTCSRFVINPCLRPDDWLPGYTDNQRTRPTSRGFLQDARVRLKHNSHRAVLMSGLMSRWAREASIIRRRSPNRIRPHGFLVSGMRFASMFCTGSAPTTAGETFPKLADLVSAINTSGIAPDLLRRVSVFIQLIPRETRDGKEECAL